MEKEKERTPEPTCEKNIPLSLPVLDLRGGRDEILRYFQNTWELTEILFSSLASEEAF